ncbi:MAG: hypothetical protein QM675_09270 [Protaetiibacter sp.]
MTPAEVTAAVTVGERVSRELDEDYVGLWVIPWHLHRELPNASADAVREIAESILRVLVAADVALGDLDGETGVFLPWGVPDPVGVAIAAWALLGREPNIGEVAWLARTS